MALKDDAADWRVSEQIVRDELSGLTLQFEVIPDSDAPFRLRIFGDVPFRNREFLFDRNGAEAGAGSYADGLCKPTWRTRIDD